MAFFSPCGASSKVSGLIEAKKIVKIIYCAFQKILQFPARGIILYKTKYKGRR
jgi:hypothetical protein